MRHFDQYEWIHRSQFFNKIQQRLTISLIMLVIVGLFPLLPILPTITVKAAIATIPTFTPQFFTKPDNTNNVVVGDINNDGFLDIVAANMSGESDKLYLNDGKGSFPTAYSFGGVDSTLGIAVGDVNGDGFLDIVTDSAVYLNDGMTNFSTGQQFSDGGSSVALGDLNGDGFLDIVVGRSGQQSGVYFNDGSAHFPSSNLFGDSDNTRSVAVGDLNNDGFLDIIAGNSDQQNAVYINDKFGNFTTRLLLGRVDNTQKVVLGDIDNNGTLDIVFGNDSYPGLLMYLNDGHANFPSILGDSTVKTQGLSIGDINGDGYIDILIGGLPGILDAGAVGTLYINDEKGRFYSYPFGNGDATVSVALGDFNSDGSLDVVVGNQGQQSAVYQNNGAVIFPGPQPFGSSNVATSIAVGDLNGDDALDVVAANNGQSNEMYINNGSGNFSTVRPFGIAGSTQSVAVGDLNNDSFLDIITGNNNQQSAVYLNDGKGNFSEAHLFGKADSTQSVAVGDLNGDGALDIVLGNDGQQSVAYLNDGLGNFFVAQAFGKPDRTLSIALGDFNGDGALDIVAGNDNEGQQSKIYLNDGKGHFSDGYPVSNDEGVRSVAVGDFNGDGALDVVTGSFQSQSVVYLNDGTGKFPVARSFGEASFTYSVVTGDFNGDGAFDIAVGTFGSRNAIYLNDGLGNFAIGSLYGTNSIQNLAVGDINGDSLPDIIVAFSFLPAAFYPNAIAQSQRLPNDAPVVTVMRPGSTKNANFYSTPVILNEQTIPIKYALFDSNGDMVRAVSATYSLDGGGSWRPAIAATGTITTDLATSPNGTTYTYNWDTFASGFFGQSDNVVFRIVAYPGVRPTKNGVPGPYQHPYTSATTFPFRVRGTQVRVVENGVPVSNAVVYRLPAGQSGNAQPLTAGSTTPLTTDAQGYLRGRGQIGVGDQLIAMRPISTTDALSETYTLYHTNSMPTPTGVTGFLVNSPGVQQIEVSASHPLALFKLDVSLEWDARKDIAFMNQLQSDLARTSEFLFDATRGQAALGEVRIFQDKQWWDAVDLRIYASNRVRPNSTVGGVATQTITDPVSLETAASNLPAIIYGSGQVQMGAVWNRFGNSGTNLSEDWPRTLAHELGHYLFFQEDNYVGTDDTGQIISVDSCPGLMSDPYASNAKFHPDTGWLPGCAQTLSNRSTGRSDWATIKTFYPTLVAPTVAIDHPSTAGPTRLPLAVTQITTYDPITPTTTLDVPIFYLAKPDGSRYQPGPSARGYLFREDANNPQNPPTGLTSLGRTNLDQIQARGAHSSDRVCLYAPDDHLFGCQRVTPGNEQIQLTSFPDWHPDLTVTPVNSTTFALSVANVSNDVQALGMQAQLFPADDLPPTAPIALTAMGNGVYQGMITTPEPLDQTQVYLWVNDATDTSRRELVTSVSVGGNPGYKRTGGGYKRTGGGYKRTGGGYKRTGGGFLRVGNAPVSSAEGDVLLVGDDLTFQAGQFLMLQSTTNIPNPPSWATVIGNAYRFTTSPSVPDLSKTSLSFSYLGSDVPPGEEDGVQVYFWNGSTWMRLPTTLNTYYNIASVRNQGPGVYALMSSVRIPIARAGWNNVAYPVHATLPVTVALGSIDGFYTTVYGYDAVDAGDPWKVYDVAAPDWVNDLGSLQFGHGYWINATEAITLYLKGGTSSSATTSAAQRANTINSLPIPPATYYGVAPVVAPEGGLTVQALVNGVVCGRAQTQKRIIAGQLQDTFVITVDAADIGTSPGCGTPGQQVILSFLDSRSEIKQVATMWDNSRVHEVSFTIVYLPNVMK